MDQETKYINRFGLNPDETVLIRKFNCMYHGKGIPVPGTLFIFNDNVCFSSKFNQKTFLGKTKIILPIKDLILCEFHPKSFGTGISLTVLSAQIKHGPNFQFNNLGEEGQNANYLIGEMMDGLRAKDSQRKNLDDEMLIEIEREMERKAIANSMMEISNTKPHHEEEVKQVVEDQQQQDA